jgi:ABC-2 type transport system permease protein
VLGVPYGLFLVPGLTVMAMVQNAFANTSSSIVIAKVQGNIVDVLMPPLSAFELTLGYVAGGVTRGLLVGCAVWLTLSLFVGFAVHDAAALLFFAINACLMLSLLGLIGGIWSEKIDHIAAVTNFVVMPLSFLSGTFYTVDRLPEGWQFLAHLNPFFYMIDGVRYGALGHADASLWVGSLMLLGVNLALFLLAWRIFHLGWRLKA